MIDSWLATLVGISVGLVVFMAGISINVIFIPDIQTHFPAGGVIGLVGGVVCGIIAANCLYEVL